MNAMLKIGDFVESGELHSPVLSVQLPRFWLLLQVDPNTEFKVARTFDRRSISYYLPTFLKSTLVGGLNRKQRQRRETPMFPGLMFMPESQSFRGLADVGGVQRFRTMSTVGNDRQLAYVTPKDIKDIRMIEAVAAVPPSKRERLFAAGNLLRITDGPFQGWTGRFERLDGAGRLRVLLKATKRAMPLVLDEHQVELV